MTTEELIRHLYNLLKPVQKQMFHRFFEANESRKHVAHSSRRLGKTFFLVVLSMIICISKSNAQVRFASVTQKAVRKMIHPIFKHINSTLPLKYRFKWNGQEGAYFAYNDSQIHVAGVNNGHEDDLRGTAADLAVVDEASFVDNLGYLVDSVLIPQLLTVPNAKLIMASSSPLSPAHEFVHYIQESKLSKTYSSYDIYEGGYPEELVEEFCKEAGGKNSTTWRREFLNELIVDEEYSIIPEFNKSLNIGTYTPDKFDQFYHRYTSLDIGVRDKTALLFAVYNFKEAKLYITSEETLEGKDVTTKRIAELISQNETTKPYLRVSDNNNLVLLQDLQADYSLWFKPTSKDSLNAMVNELRLWVQSGRVVIDPGCEQTIGCLEYGVWNKNKQDWAKSKVYGHFDALASLMYLVRNIDQNTNPIPQHFGTNIATHFTPPDTKITDTHDTIRSIFNIK